MEPVVLTTSHWVFLAAIVLIFVFILMRKDVVLPTIIGIFLLGVLNSPKAGLLDTSIFGLQTIFNSLLNAGVELFDIMLVISLMVAMLRSLQSQGADVLMIEPVKKIMVNPTIAFFALGVTMYIAATFFWPTPAVALVGVVLIPIAVQAGLPAIGAAVSVSLFGHGMALAGDLVIQGAPRLTSSAAGLETTDILGYTAIFTFIVGAIAIATAFYAIRRDMRKGKLEIPKTDVLLGQKAEEASDGGGPETNDAPAHGKYARFFARFVPIVLLVVVALMIYRAMFNPENAITGGAATGLLGGVAVSMLILATAFHEGVNCFERLIDHLREGFFFAIKIFAPVIPIAGFFFLGHPKHAASILGEGTPGFLFDIGTAIGSNLGDSSFILPFGIALIGLLTGLDGSGFSGLPLVGGLSSSLGMAAGVDVAVLASIGQVAAIFAGGGTLVAWAFGVAADAGIAGVKPVDLVRRNFGPVMLGMVVACIVAVILM